MKTIGYDRDSAPDPRFDPGDPGSEVEVTCSICEREFLVDDWSLPVDCDALLPSQERFSELWRDPTWIYKRLCNGFTPLPAFDAAERVRQEDSGDPFTVLCAVSTLLHVAWHESEHQCRAMIATACTNRESGHVYAERQAQLWDLLSIPDREPWCHGVVALPDDDGGI
jgi:hypothetical protein